VRARPTLAAGALGALAAVGCADERPVEVTVPPLTLTATPAALELTAGDSARITVAAAGGVPRPLRLVWRSSDPAVVAVDTTGQVRALDAGAAVISVDVAGEGGPWLGIPVTAVAPCSLGVPVSGLAASVPFRLDLGRTGRPRVYAGACRPGGDSTLVYQSSDTAIVAIDAATGLPLGRAEGQATATVRLRAAPSVRVAVPVTVARPSCIWVGVSLIVQPAALTLAPGESAQLAISVSLAPGAPPSERPVPMLASSDSTVATVGGDGTVRGNRPGAAVITVSVTTAAGCGPVSQAVAVTVRSP
jgi:hypothetical protein